MDLVCEAIINAPAIAKRVRSANPQTGKGEYLYIVTGETFEGTVIYTKGKILKAEEREGVYVLISSKKSAS